MILERVIKLPWYKRLLTLRKVFNLTQEEVAKRCGTTQKTYWNWENGIHYPSKYYRKLLAKIYNLNVQSIFTKER